MWRQKPERYPPTYENIRLAADIHAGSMRTSSHGALVSMPTLPSNLDRSERTDVLVTRARFSSGQPSGVALVNMAKQFHRAIKSVVTAAPEVAHFADDLGIVLVAPVDARDVVNAVSQAVARQQ